tara:strand:- start:122 stop:442 length:321 start_codon:yes stop_codon:yes gene_type:complete
MLFQKTVIGIATIILIGLLVFIGYSIQKDKTTISFPPVLADCPDYWDSKDSECINTQGLGNCNIEQPKNFDNPIYQGDKGMCEKYKWANSCNIAWDGITNSPDICN